MANSRKSKKPLNAPSSPIIIATFSQGLRKPLALADIMQMTAKAKLTGAIPPKNRDAIHRHNPIRAEFDPGILSSSKSAIR